MGETSLNHICKWFASDLFLYLKRGRLTDGLSFSFRRTLSFTTGEKNRVPLGAME